MYHLESRKLLAPTAAPSLPKFYPWVISIIIVMGKNGIIQSHECKRREDEQEGETVGKEEEKEREGGRGMYKEGGRIVDGMEEEMKKGGMIEKVGEVVG